MFALAEDMAARQWQTDAIDVVDGQPELRMRAWGALVRKRFPGQWQAADGPAENGRWYDLSPQIRLVWQEVAALAALEETPGELAHLCEHGAALGSVELAAAPPVASLTYHLIVPTGLRLVCQPAWTPEDLAGDETGGPPVRPAAVVGSYAAYLNGRKLFHLLRPCAIGNDARRLWGQLQAERLAADTWAVTVSFDPPALAAMAYPVRIDGNATFGYTSIGGSSVTTSEDYIVYHGSYGVAGGTLSQISAYCSAAASTPHKLGVYRGDGTLVIGSGQGWVGTSPAWYSINVSGDLPADAALWLAQWHDTRDLTVYYDTNVMHLRQWNAHTYGGSWPESEFDIDGATIERQYSIYATYTPSGGGGNKVSGGGMGMF